ncbi:hypothetical protein AAG570_012894 [Ranatra chinensis]|uniref:Uncharacterized protein n=1 Tax=Ranatra chinensis TaxID=642074 RepID=A0ABD0YF76_9HEMI
MASKRRNMFQKNKTQETTENEGPEPYALGTFRAKLVKLTAERNWPQPVYYVIRTRCFSSQRITCISIVSIRCPMEPYKNGDFIFSSFPHKFDCAGESKDEASRKAFSDLSPLASAFYIESDTQTDPSIVTSRILEKLPTKTRIDIMKKLHDGDKALRKERDKAKFKTFKVSRGKSATENNRQAENMHPQSEKKSEPCLRGLGRGRGRIFTVLKEKELEMKQLEVKPEQTEEKKYDVERRKRRDAKRIAYMKEHNLLDPNKEYGDIFDSDDPYYDYDTTPDSSDIFFKYF